MNEMRETVVNPKTGLREYKEYEEHRPKGHLCSGVGKMAAHFEAESSLEQQRLSRITAEKERLAEVHAKEKSEREKAEQLAEQNRAARQKALRETEAKQKKQKESDLAKSMLKNRVKHVGYRSQYK